MSRLGNGASQHLVPILVNAELVKHTAIQSIWFKSHAKGAKDAKNKAMTLSLRLRNTLHHSVVRFREARESTLSRPLRTLREA